MKEKGDPLGWLHEGRIYERGLGVPRDRTRGFSLYKIAADTYHHPCAIDEVSNAYLYGNGVDTNIAEFLKYEQLGLSLQAPDIYEMRLDRLKNCGVDMRCVYCRNGKKYLGHEKEIQALYDT